MNLFSVFLGVGLGGFVSYLLTRHYYHKANTDLKTRIDKLSRELEGRETLENFEKLLDTEEWEKEYHDNEPVYVCRTSPTFQFGISDENEDFYEDWMSVFPDRNGYAYDINLEIRGTTIKSLRFVSTDGGRYTLPLPEVFLVNENQEFVWRKNSLGYKVAMVIGNFYRCETLEEVGQFVRVDVVTDQRHA